MPLHLSVIDTPHPANALAQALAVRAEGGVPLIVELGASLDVLFAVIVIGVLTALMLGVGSRPRYHVLWGIAINAVGGMAVIYLCGVIGLVIRTDLTVWAAITSNGPFIIGDVIKVVVAALVAAQVHRGRPGLIEPWRLQRARG